MFHANSTLKMFSLFGQNVLLDYSSSYAYHVMYISLRHLFMVTRFIQDLCLV